MKIFKTRLNQRILKYVGLVKPKVNGLLNIVEHYHNGYEKEILHKNIVFEGSVSNMVATNNDAYGKFCLINKNFIK